jgi:hypothetical protein
MGISDKLETYLRLKLALVRPQGYLLRQVP